MKIIILKTTLLLVLLTATKARCAAQGFFNQKGSWIKNQLKQIALWDTYIETAEKGYGIAKDGLNTLSNSKNGDFVLHLGYFNSLREINPAIKQYAKAVDLLLLQSGIEKLARKGNDAYTRAVFAHLMQECNRDVSELNRLLSGAYYQMTDDASIDKIDKLLAGMKDKYAFAKKFAATVQMLSLQQRKEKNEVQASRLLNNIKTR